MAYWLRDESEQFANTTQMVDLSLGVLVLELKSGLVDNLLELGGFMLRSQMARLMHDGSGLLDLLQLAHGLTSPPGRPKVKRSPSGGREPHVVGERGCLKGNRP